MIQGIGLSSNSLEDDGALEPLPPCFLSHLKLIEMIQFTGEEHQLKALKILLKNAKVLEKMVLYCIPDYNWVPGEKTEVLIQLSDHPRGSHFCKIVLC